MGSYAFDQALEHQKERKMEEHTFRRNLQDQLRRSWPSYEETDLVSLLFRVFLGATKVDLPKGQARALEQALVPICQCRDRLSGTSLLHLVYVSLPSYFRGSSPPKKQSTTPGSFGTVKTHGSREGCTCSLPTAVTDPAAPDCSPAAPLSVWLLPVLIAARR